MMMQQEGFDVNKEKKKKKKHECQIAINLDNVQIYKKCNV